ncbi:MAG: NADH-quinone oxidoreductase subunit N [Candidatus Aminicenantes bacterium]|nr:NADH-quinone oxidoreductase subunit N [Candidatus Aminicenantes bacterium]
MSALLPLAVVSAGAIFVLLLDAFWKRESKAHLAVVSLVILGASAFFTIGLWGRDASFFFGSSLRLDDAAILTTLLLLAAAAFTVLLGWGWIQRLDAAFGEFYGLLLLAAAGLMIMAQTRDLLVVFLGLEVFSVSAYGLTGLKRNDDKASEAAVKYFLTGSFAGAFLVFGLAVLFGLTGSFGIAETAASLGSGPTALLGFGFLLSGLAFKLALAPFHMWAPDVYEGAPTPIAGFFAVAPKAAGFLVLLRLVAAVPKAVWVSLPVFPFLYAVAALTLVVGNLGALRQKNLKRLLAYSSIAHAGTMAIAVLAGDGASLFFYLANYLFMGLGAFAALTAMSSHGREYNELDDFAGAGFKYPWIGAIFAVILISMAGFPPTGGFLAKFLVFSAGVKAGLTPLVILGVVTSLLAVAYYLRVVVVMYMRDPAPGVEIEIENPSALLVLFLGLVGVIQLGLFPANILHFIRQAAASLF